MAFLENQQGRFMSLREELIPFFLKNQYNRKLIQEFKEALNLEDGEDTAINVACYAHIQKSYHRSISDKNEYLRANFDCLNHSFQSFLLSENSGEF